MKKEIAIFIFLSIFLYLSFSFVGWNLNPKLWETKTRFTFIFLMFVNLVLSMTSNSLSKL
jgi:hypothetical protein